MERLHPKHSNNFTVGLFVLVAFFVTMGFVVFMGGSWILSGEIHIRTTFSDVRGLNVGAPVFLSGIRVGRVSEFQFPENHEGETNGDNVIVAVLSIHKDKAERIRTDSVASIATQGVLGDKVVILTPGSQAAASVKADAMLASTKGTELGEYLSKGGNLVEKLNKVADSLNVLLESINENGQLGRTVSNLESASAALSVTAQNLSAARGGLGAAINGGPHDDLGPALKSLRNILAKVDKGEGTLGALVNDPSLHEDMRILLGGAKRSQMVRFLLRQAISEGEKGGAPSQK